MTKRMSSQMTKCISSRKTKSTYELMNDKIYELKKYNKKLTKNNFDDDDIYKLYIIVLIYF